MTKKIKFIFCTILCSVFFVLCSTGWACAEGSDEDDFEDPCPILNDYIANSGGFILRGALEQVKKANDKLASGTWGFAGELQGIVAVGLAIYIALRTLKNIGSFSAQNVSAYLSDEKSGLAPVIAKATFIIFLLGQSGLPEHTINPILDAGAAIGGGGNVGHDFIATADTYYQKMYQFIAAGRLMLCAATSPGIFDWYWGLIPFGLILCVYGWILIIGLSFYLLDLAIRLTVANTLLPFAIACGVSKITSSYTRQLWSLYVNVAYNYIVIGVVVDLSSELIGNSLSGVKGSSLFDLLNPDSGAMHKPDVETLVQNLDVMAFLLLCLSCIVTFKLFMNCENIAKGVSGAAGPGKAAQQFGGSVAKTASNAVAKPATGLAKAAGKQALADVKNDVKNSEVGRAVRAGVNAVDSTISKGTSKVSNYVSNKANKVSNSVKGTRVGRAAFAVGGGVKKAYNVTVNWLNK